MYVVHVKCSVLARDSVDLERAHTACIDPPMKKKRGHGMEIVLA